MVAPFEVVLKDSALQENWFRRLIAAIVDWIILAIVYAILAALLLIGWFVAESATGIGPAFNFGRIAGISALGLVFWVLGILYFSLMESMWGASVGKSLLGLAVVGEDGKKPLLVNAVIRNVSRIHGLLFLLDFIGGLVLEGDPRQRFTDRIAKTVVYQKKSNRGGPYIEPRVLGTEEARAAATGATAPPGQAPPSQPPGETPQGQEDEAMEQPTEAGTSKCPSCEAAVKPGDSFCPKCGAKLA